MCPDAAAQRTTFLAADSPVEFNSGDGFGGRDGRVEFAEYFGRPERVSYYVSQADRAIRSEGEVGGEEVGFNGRHRERRDHYEGRY